MDELDDQSTLCRTTLLIPSIHCSSCISFIQDVLTELYPKAWLTKTSIADHSIVLHHGPSFDIANVADKLGEAGYEVDDLLTEILENHSPPCPSSEAASPKHDTLPVPWLSRATKRWSRSKGKNADETNSRHKQHCRACNEQMSDKLLDNNEKMETTSNTEKSPEKTASTFVAVDSLKPPKVYKAEITVDGMSCSSCVGSITSALERNHWVKTANVSLLTRMAMVEFYEQEGGTAQELVNIIEDLGFDPSLEQVVTISHPKQGPSASAQPDSQLWQATMSILGMTCSSCVGTVTEALESNDQTRNVEVNLITSSATVTIQEKASVQGLINTVTDLGYEASLIGLVDLNKVKSSDSRRTVSICISGMYCQHCSNRVVETIRVLNDSVDVQTPPTLTKPIMTVSYKPDAPTFTLRTILSAVSVADAAFSASIHHPPSVEERARQMLARTKRRIFYRLILSLTAAIPTFIIGIVYMNLVPASTPGHHYLMETLAGISRAEWALLIMATPVYFFAADVFHRSMIKGLYSLWRPGSKVPLARRFFKFGSMNMLISFATSIAYFSSIAELIIATTRGDGHHEESKAAHIDAVVFLTLFLLVGRMIEVHSKAKTGDAVDQLGQLRPKQALLVVQGEGGDGAGSETRDTSIDMLEAGDLVRVVHGASPPWDGVLVKGESDFIESSLTGESRPVRKKLGDTVYSGTINHGRPITMQVSGAPGDSLLDQIIQVVREGQARRAPIERVADTITGYFVPVATFIAITTWLTWLALGESGVLPDHYRDVSVGGWPFWSLQFAIAVFVIACPCGIGLAAPTALFVGGGLAAKHGILAKGGGEAFQEASRLDVVVFDKTGTLTEGGDIKLTDHRIMLEGEGGWHETTMLSCLRELESNSSHSIAKAVVAFCKSRGALEDITLDKVEELPGRGMKGVCKIPELPHRMELIVGNELLMQDYGVILDETTLVELSQWKEQAKSVVLVSARISSTDNDDSQWKLLATFATSDALRPEAASIIGSLRKQGIDVWMLSGDNAMTANAVGAMVGIPHDHIIAGVLPEQKADKVKYLQQSQSKTTSKLDWLRGRPQTHRATVAMVGDGVNDSPALTVADVGIAIGSGSDVAISAAEFVLVNSNLTTLLTLTSLSKTVFHRVLFNFAWASIYNMVALPVAAGVLYPIRTSSGQHTRLDPVWAALAMALSSISVVSSSLLLKTRLPVVGYREQGPRRRAV